MGIALGICAGIATAGVYDDLLKALEDNNTEAVTTILQRGMDVNTVDKSGNSLLMLAGEKGNVELVSFLIEHLAPGWGRKQYGDKTMI